jgi:hypothetical protein
MCRVNIKIELRVQVKNKPWLVNIIMRLIPWKHPRSSKTVAFNEDNISLSFIKSLHILCSGLTVLFPT